MTRFERWALTISMSLFLASAVIYGITTQTLTISALH
jgi:hypothetical protein